MNLPDFNSLKPRVTAYMAHSVHAFQLMRLRLERFIARLRGSTARPRVLATACWSFPIWSQTFVYQELTHLIRHGIDVRFLYSELNPRKYLPAQFSRLWRARRRLILHPHVCRRDYAYFMLRMPEKIDRLVSMLSQASGMPPQDVRSHYHILQAFSFTRMVEAYRPAYLHSYFFYEGTLFTFIASYLLDIPRGVSCYADHVLKDYVLKVVPLHLGQCSLAVATSNRIKRELINLAPDADPDRIIVKPNGINPDRFPVLDRRDPEAGQPYRLITVSRIEPKKGLVYLVEAVRLLRDQGLNVELHMLGEEDGSEASKICAEAIKHKIAELGIGKSVHLEGRKNEGEINQFFKKCHIFAAPSVETESGDKDGIPTSLLEAMASGLPAVATDAGSIPEVIEDGRDGLIVPQRDPAALASAIEKLLRDPTGRLQLGREAAEKIRRSFDVGVCEKIFHERVLAVIADHGKNIHPLRGKPWFRLGERLRFVKNFPKEVPFSSLPGLVGSEIGMLDPKKLTEYNNTRQTKNKTIFCHAPFVNMNFSQNGNITACCYSRDFVFGTYSQNTLEEIWHGKKANKLRQFMRKNILPVGGDRCDICKIQFQGKNFGGLRAKSFDLFAEENAPEGKVPWPKMMEFEISNVCNLECIMCSGFFSSAIRKNREKLPADKCPYDEIFIKQLEPFIPHLTVAKFLGGEPFLISAYFQIWDLIIRLNPKIQVSITTNGTTLTSKVKNILEKLNAHLIISVDSLEKENYERIRINADFDRVMNNVEYYRDYVKRKKTSISFAVNPMQQNWKEMPSLLEFCNQRAIELYFNTVLYPDDATLKTMNRNDLKAVVEYLNAVELIEDTGIRKNNNANYRDLIQQISYYRDQST